MRLMVSGVPGVGKSTVSREIARMCELEIVNLGDEIMKQAQGRTDVSKRDDLRRIPRAELDHLREKAVHDLATRARFLLDSHLMIRTPAGLVPGFEEWWVPTLGLTHLLVVEAEPSRIVTRRKAERERTRDDETAAAIAEHQLANRAMANELSTRHRVKLRFVDNGPDSKDEALASLGAWLGNAT